MVKRAGSKAQVKKEPTIVRYSDGDTKAIEINPDGTAFGYYPSGNIALCLIHIKRQNVTIKTLYCYEDKSSKPGILAAIDSRGQGYAIRGEGESGLSPPQGIEVGYKLISDQRGVRLTSDKGILIPHVVKELAGADLTLDPRVRKPLSALSGGKGSTAAAKSPDGKTSPEALAFRGRRYFYGIGVPKNQRRGAEYYRRAAAQGHKEATYHLGMCFEHGTGVPRDLARAADLYGEAAKGGVVQAMVNLGNMLAFGKGSLQDPVRAQSLLETAAGMGSSSAAFALRRLANRDSLSESKGGAKKKTAAAAGGGATKGSGEGKVWSSGRTPTNTTRNWSLPVEFDVCGPVSMRFASQAKVEFRMLVDGVCNVFHIARRYEDGGVKVELGEAKRSRRRTPAAVAGGASATASPKAAGGERKRQRTLFKKQGVGFKAVGEGELEPGLDPLREARLIQDKRGPSINLLTKTIRDRCSTTAAKTGVAACGILERGDMIRQSSGKYSSLIPTKKISPDMLSLPLLRDSNFKKTIEAPENARKLVVVACLATWQPTCDGVLNMLQVVHATVRREAKKRGDECAYKLYQYDMSSSRMMTALYNLKSAPAILMYYGGRLVLAEKWTGRGIKLKNKRPLSRKVLLVEPNFLMQTRYEEVLKRLGVSWNLALNSADVSRFAEHETTEENRYGVAVIDLDLPSSELASIASSARLSYGEERVYVIGITASKGKKTAIVPNEILRKPAGARMVEKAMVKAIAKVGKSEKYKGVDGKGFVLKMADALQRGSRGQSLGARFKFSA